MGTIFCNTVRIDNILKKHVHLPFNPEIAFLGHYCKDTLVKMKKKSSKGAQIHKALHCILITYNLVSLTNKL